MKKEKTKQIILMVVAFMFMGIGWLNFYHQQKSMEVAAKEVRNELNLGDVQLVNSEVTNESLQQTSEKIADSYSNKNQTENEEKNYLSEIVSNDELEKVNEQVSSTTSDSTNEEINQQVNQSEQEVSQEVNYSNEQNNNQYFVETKLQRDTMYSEMLETYQKMLENPDVGETQKAIATQEISNINNIKNGIMIAENLIKNKGFEEVVILVNNGTVSVVIKSSLLNQEQIAQIQNIVSRELNVQLTNIHISKK